MPFQLDMRFENPQVLAQLAGSLSQKEFRQGLFRFLDVKGEQLAGRVITQSLSGQILKRRTGSLARGVVGQAEINPNGLPSVRVGSLRGPSLKYAEILESGGIIRPKKAKALAIPVGEALTPAGVSRYASPRDFPAPLRYVPVNRGRFVGFLMREDLARRQDSVNALFLLVRSVTIPAFRWLSRPIGENLPWLSQEIARYIVQNIAR